MLISRIFDDIMDWATDGGIFRALGLASVFTAAVVGIVLAPFIYVAYRNDNKYSDLIKGLDIKQSFSFSSVEACEATGRLPSICIASKDAAFDWANSLGTTISYSNMNDCENNHGQNCTEHIDTITTYTTISTGKDTSITIPITTTTTSYLPRLVGWQAAADDLTEAVPLYATSNARAGLRRDGKLITLDIH